MPTPVAMGTTELCLNALLTQSLDHQTKLEPFSLKMVDVSAKERAQSLLVTTLAPHRTGYSQFL